MTSRADARDARDVVRLLVAQPRRPLFVSVKHPRSRRDGTLEPPTSANRRGGAGASRKQLRNRCAPRTLPATQPAHPAGTEMATAKELEDGHNPRQTQVEEAAAGHEGQRSLMCARKSTAERRFLCTEKKYPRRAFWAAISMQLCKEIAKRENSFNNAGFPAFCARFRFL